MKKITIRLVLTSVFLLGVVIGNVQSVYGLDGSYDPQFYANNGILFYNPDDVSCADKSFSIGSIKNVDYTGSPMLNGAQLTAISENQPFYKKAADSAGIPWQVLAAIHYRETGFRRYGPSNGAGPYQITGSNSPIAETYTDDQFQAASDAAAQFVKNKMGGGYDYTQPDNVKRVFFAYNGTGDVYINQAKALGFTDAQAANGEGSPYVMNKTDARRDPTVQPTKSNNTWGQIVTDGGPMHYPANNDYGAFAVYAILAGIGGTGTGSASDCAFSGNGLTLDQAKKFISRYEAIDNGDPNGDGKYIKPAITCHTNTDNCVAMSVFFINKYTDLKPVSVNGGVFVSRFAAANSDIQVSKVPQPFSIFSIADGVTMCDGIPCGHTGVVLGIDPAKDEIYTAEAAWCKPGYTNIYVHKLSAWTNQGYSFAYTGSHFKQDVLMKDVQ